MKIIPTTATQVDKLNRLAKTRRKKDGVPLAAALDEVARQHGYASWHHVTLCREQTPRTTAAVELPSSLSALLGRAFLHEPAQPDTLRAFESGLVFAMDVKDAQNLKLTKQIAPCDDGWHIAARYLWPALVNQRNPETGESWHDSLDDRELASEAMDDMQNYRFFRRVGEGGQATLPAAYEFISKVSFFAPTHIWSAGRFFDLAQVPEIRVNGEVVYATTPISAGHPPAPEGAKDHRLWHLLNEEERRLFGSMQPHEQDMLLHMARKRTARGADSFQPVMLSVKLS